MSQIKLRVLWLCNSPLSDSDVRVSGTWLAPMAHGLLDSGAIELGIIASGPIREFARRDFGQVKQWIVPSKIPLRHDGLPPAALVRAITEAANEFSPDLIHVWGTEAYWGILPVRGLLAYPTLLEIQGLKSECAKVFYGGLSRWERLGCIGLKEVLKRRTMWSDRRGFARWGLFEKEVIRGHRFISVASRWEVAQVKAFGSAAKMFPVERALRKQFYDAEGWKSPRQPVLFCIAAYTSPFKGLHTAIRALGLLRKRIPSARLRIAGAHQRAGIRQDGYMRWVNRMICRLNLADSIEWLGPLNGEQIITELENAKAIISPSFIETYCLSVAEAMILGTPTVVAFTGGPAWLGKDEQSCLFFPPGDEAMCAYQLERVLTDQELAFRLSRESRRIAVVRNDLNRIVQQQLNIYRQVIEE